MIYKLFKCIFIGIIFLIVVCFFRYSFIPTDLIPLPSDEEVELINKDKIFCDENEEQMFAFVQPTFKDDVIDTSKFNYEGNCSKVFVSRNNNKRDLLIVAIRFTKSLSWKKQKETTLKVLDINNSGIPDATKILFLYGKVPKKGFVNLIRSHGYDVIHSNRNLPKGTTASVYRFIDAEIYLKEHEGEYDRVALTDFRDVAWFADGFATIKEKELFISKECFGDPPKCVPISLPWQQEQIVKTLGEEVNDKLMDLGGDIINAGMIMGDIESVMKFLSIYNTEAMKYSHLFHIWELDQVLLNVVYHFGMLNHLPLTINTRSQRYGFGKYEGSFTYDEKNKIFYDYNSTCSPVIRHKVMNYFL